MKYNTKQKKLLLDIFDSNPSHLYSTKELREILKDNISKATLYRLLDLLCKDNILKSSFNEKLNCHEYQLVKDDTCCHHLHLKCDYCGKIYHLDNFKIPQFNDFLIDFTHTLIHGTCKMCKLERR